MVTSVRLVISPAIDGVSCGVNRLAGAYGPGYRASGFVFTNLNGDPMAPDRLTRMFKKLAAEAGLRAVAGPCRPPDRPSPLPAPQTGVTLAPGNCIPWLLRAREPCQPMRKGS